MASEAKIRELYQVSKGSKYFEGISDDDVWAACQNYLDRSDEDIDIAIDRIKKRNQELELNENEAQNKLNLLKEQQLKNKELEAKERLKELESAEKLLEKLF